MDPLSSPPPPMKSSRRHRVRRQDQQPSHPKIGSVSFAVSPPRTTSSKKGHKGGGAFRRAFKQWGMSPLFKNNDNNEGPTRAPSTTTTHLSESTPLVNDHDAAKGREGRKILNGGDDHALTDDDGDDDNFDYANTDQENPGEVERRQQRARQAWQRIASEVKNGGMLLRAVAIDPMGRTLSTDERERAREETLEWIRQGQKGRQKKAKAR